MSVKIAAALVVRKVFEAARFLLTEEKVKENC